MTHGVSANTTWCGLRDAAGSVSYSKDVEDVDCIDCFRFRVRDLVEQVEELERAPRCCADTIPPGCRTCRCADAAEAKLARCVEALEQIGWADPYKGNVIDAMKQTALDALAAAKGKDDDWERRGEALRQIEREGKSASDVWALRCASVARAALEGASVHDPGRLKEALRRVLTEAGMQAHKHGCPNRLVRPARWDEHRPCAGCEAEAALIDTVVAKEG